MTLLTSCTSPSARPYTLPTPIAQTGPQHVLLGQPIDLNTADVTQLTALPGIGPALAEQIVADRRARGPFRSIAELDRVHGIGKALTQKLGPYLQVTSKN